MEMWGQDGITGPEMEKTLFAWLLLGFCKAQAVFWMWRFLINSAQLVLGWPTITSDCGDLGAILSSYVSFLPLSSVSLQELHTQSLPCSVPIPGLSAFALGPYLQCVHSHSGSPVVNFFGVAFSFHLSDCLPAAEEKGPTLQKCCSLVKSTGFSAEPKWRSFSVENKQNPFIYGTSFFFPESHPSQTWASCQGTWNHSMNWARLSVWCWKLGESCLVCISHPSVYFSCSMYSHLTYCHMWFDKCCGCQCKIHTTFKD